MKSENPGEGKILKIGRNNFISIAIFTFHHKFLHFDEKFDFDEKRQISTFPSDFRDFCMSRISPRSGQGVTLGQRHFFKV